MLFGITAPHPPSLEYRKLCLRCGLLLTPPVFYSSKTGAEIPAAAPRLPPARSHAGRCRLGFTRAHSPPAPPCSRSLRGGAGWALGSLEASHAWKHIRPEKPAGEFAGRRWLLRRSPSGGVLFRRGDRGGLRFGRSPRGSATRGPLPGSAELRLPRAVPATLGRTRSSAAAPEKIKICGCAFSE